jgi:hypothetical protein
MKKMRWSGKARMWRRKGRRVEDDKEEEELLKETRERGGKRGDVEEWKIEKGKIEEKA